MVQCLNFLITHISLCAILYDSYHVCHLHCVEATKYSKLDTIKQLVPFMYICIIGVKEVKMNTFKRVSFVSFGSLRNNSDTSYERSNFLS